MSNFTEKRWVDQRAYARVPIMIPGSVAISGQGVKSDCLVSDLSLGGAGIQYISNPPLPEMICKLSVAQFGEFEGITTRNSGTILGIRFFVGEHERQCLFEKLQTYVEDGLAGVKNFRKCERRPSSSQLTLTRPCGEKNQCDVLDISLRGVALKTDVRPPVGELVILGRMYGRIVRHFDDGIAVQFINFVSLPDVGPPTEWVPPV